MEVAPRQKLLEHCLPCQTVLRCFHSSMYAYIYCQGRLERYWNGLKCFFAKSGVGDWTGVNQVFLHCYDYQSTSGASKVQKFLKLHYILYQSISPDRLVVAFYSCWEIPLYLLCTLKGEGQDVCLQQKKTIKDTNEIFQPDDPILCKQTPGNDKVKENFKPIYRQRVAEVAVAQIFGLVRTSPRIAKAALHSTQVTWKVNLKCQICLSYQDS